MTAATSMHNRGMSGEEYADARGRLILTPAPLDFGCPPPLPAIEDVLPAGTLRHMAATRYWVCENAKTLRALLKRVDAITPLATSLQELHITELPRHWHKQGDHIRMPQTGLQREQRHTLQSPRSQRRQRDVHTVHSAQQHMPKNAISTAQQSDAQWMHAALAPALAGHDVALASEAGMPAVADPGSSLVRMAHTLGLEVLPLTGPCSLLLALAASGLNGQNFAFVGYLPHDTAVRVQRLHELEHIARHTGQSQLWIETPYRNQALYTHAVQVLQPHTMLTVAQGLTLADAHIHTRSIAAHCKQPVALAERLPAVFGLGV